MNNEQLLQKFNSSYFSQTSLKKKFTQNDLKEKVLNKMIRDEVVIKRTVFQEEQFSLNNDLNFCVQKYKILPSTITSYFRPLPVLDRKEYIFHLFYYNIDVYSLYPESQHEKIENLQMEFQEIIDEFRSYFEFNIFSGQSEKIKLDNQNLYDLLKEKNEKSKLYKKIKELQEKNEKDLIEDNEYLNKLKIKTTKKLI